MKRIGLLVFVLCGVLVFCLATAGAVTKATFYLEWFESVQHAPFLIADELGFYEEEGLDLSIQPGGFDPSIGLKMLMSGKADIVLMEASFLMQVLVEQQVTIKAIGSYYHEPPTAWYGLPSHSFVSFPDLKGLRINQASSFAAGMGMRVLLRLYGLDPEKDVVWVDVGYGPGPVLAGETDFNHGFIMDEPFGILQEADGVTTIWWGDWIDTYGLTLITNEAEMERKPEVIRAFLRGSLKGIHFVEDYPEETIAILVKRIPDLNPSQASWGLKALLATVWKDKSERGTHNYFWMDVERWTNTLRWFYFIGYIDNVVDPEALFTNEFIP